MTSEQCCVEDHDLLALAAGDSVPGNVETHVLSCERCQERIQQLASEIGNLRANGWSPVPDPVYVDSLDLFTVSRERRVARRKIQIAKQLTMKCAKSLDISVLPNVVPGTDWPQAEGLTDTLRAALRCSR